MLDRNPLQVQDPSRSTTGTPLVLIHDGGGTTFGYFSLGSLKRQVWAIHNPRYASPDAGKRDTDADAVVEGREWRTMDEMAEEYIGLMRDAGIQGEIILGGWSLGGYISLAIARILADRNEDFSVKSLLLIDAPHHVPYEQVAPEDGEPDFDGLPPLVRKALDECDDLLARWEVPGWDGAVGDVTLNAGGMDHTLREGEVVHKPLAGGWKTMRSKEVGREGSDDGYATDAEKMKRPPPAVLVKCTKPVPSKNDTDACCNVDVHRNDPTLGWLGRYPDFIKAVLEVDSDHYNIFGLARVKQTTEKINQALGVLDSMSVDEAKASDD